MWVLAREGFVHWASGKDWGSGDLKRPKNVAEKVTMKQRLFYKEHYQIYFA